MILARKNLVSVVTGSALAFFLAVFLSAGAHFVQRGPILEHVRENIKLMNNFRRSDTFTECIVMGAAILPDGQKDTLAEGIFDFSMLKGMTPDKSIPHDHETCASLRAFLNGQSAEQIGLISYTRYWNGPVSMARFMLGLMPFIVAYIVYAIAGFAAFALWGFALSRNGLTAKSSGWIAFACFYGAGLPYVVGNLAHTPAFIAPVLLISAITLKNAWWRNLSDTVFLAGFIGGVTFYFDMLFMAIPFNAIFLGATWLLLTLSDKKLSAKTELLNTLVYILAAYAFSGAVMLGLKVLMIGVMHDPSAVFADFAHQLFWRMSNEDAHGTHFDLIDLFTHTLPTAATKMFFHPLMSLIIYCAGIGFFVKAFAKNMRIAFAFALLAMITPVWYLIFTNHSYIHGTFAMRILFWPPLLGCLAWLAARNKLAAHAVS